MLITKEQQEAMVQNYTKENHSTDECNGFINGIKATMDLISKLNTSGSLHYFKPSKDNTIFCTCGKYLTNDCHKKKL